MPAVKFSSGSKWGFSRKVLFLLVILSVLLRILFIPNYLTEAHGFRQTQTAITVQDWINHGFDLVNYRTPVLGSPWTLPMEFPTFQASAYGLYHLLLPITDNLDVALRVTAILYFYLSFFAFSKLAYLLFERLDKGALYYKVSILIYLFSPFAIFWSKTSMIEYCAVVFQLLYIWCFLRLLYDQDQKKILLVLGALFFGGIGYLTKSTTMIPAVFFLLICSLQCYWPKLRDIKKLLVRKEILKIIWLFVIAILPFIIGIVWVKYSDQVKVQSGYSYLTSEGLREWNFGGLDVRLNPSFYVKLLKNLEEVLPMILLVISAGFLYYFRKRHEETEPLKIRKQYCTALLFAVFGTALTLFNLYSAHSYYSIAVSPFLFLAGGFLYSDFVGYTIKTKKKLLVVVSAGLILFNIGFSPLVRLQTWRPDHSEDGNVASGLWIKDHSDEDDLLLIFNHDFDPVVPYYANRRALMVNYFLDNYDTIDKTFSDYQFMVTGSSEENWLSNARAFHAPQTELIHTENGNNIFWIQSSDFDTSAYGTRNESFIVSLQKQDEIIIGEISAEADNKIRSVYCKADNKLKSTWLNCDDSGRIRFAVKTDPAENEAEQFVILYENNAGEKSVSEVIGLWR